MRARSPSPASPCQRRERWLVDRGHGLHASTRLAGVGNASSRPRRPAPAATARRSQGADPSARRPGRPPPRDPGPRATPSPCAATNACTASVVVRGEAHARGRSRRRGRTRARSGTSLLPVSPADPALVLQAPRGRAAPGAAPAGAPRAAPAGTGRRRGARAPASGAACSRRPRARRAGRRRARRPRSRGQQALQVVVDDGQRTSRAGRGGSGRSAARHERGQRRRGSCRSAASRPGDRDLGQLLLGARRAGPGSPGACRTSACPASVSPTGRVPRSTSGQPDVHARGATCWLTADWVSPSSSAATGERAVRRRPRSSTRTPAGALLVPLMDPPVSRLDANGLASSSVRAVPRRSRHARR